MTFVSCNGLKYFKFETFPAAQVRQGIFTRNGGVSPHPWVSLNLGGNIGDRREHIIENRKRLFDSISRPVHSLHDVWQVHSASVIHADQPRGLNIEPIQADAMITDNPEVTLYMRFADCVPIFLYDPEKHAAGLVHAGWGGTVKKIVCHAVQAMQIHFGSKPEDILAGIGPSIGPDHYEVKSDVISQVTQSFGKKSRHVLIERDNRVFLDLWQANRITLEEAGLAKIEIAGICTACNMEDWYSHRGEYGKTGRFGAVLALEK